MSDYSTEKPLSEDERAELEQLRAERENRQNEPQAAPANVPEKELPDTHWIHLANGDVFTAKGIASHVDGIPVIGTYEIPPHLQEGNTPAEPAHRF